MYCAFISVGSYHAGEIRAAMLSPWHAEVVLIVAIIIRQEHSDRTINVPLVANLV